MDFQEFKTSLSRAEPPEKLGKALQALWYDARGEWDTAHQLAQSVNDATGAWVHAYLHRKEGDLANAGYWYSRANKTMSRDSLAAEWEQIVKALL